MGSYKGTRILLVLGALLGLHCGPTPIGQEVPLTSEQPIFGGGPETGYPAVGMLQYTVPNGRFFCTGTLIRPNIVISAAHCFLESTTELIPFSRVDFILGQANNPTEVVRVAAYITHPNHVDLHGETDLSIMRLERSITSVSPAVLSSLREAP